MIEALNTLPLNELIRRARILGELSGVPEQELRGARVLGWQNGAGDDVAWVIPPGGGALLLVLDHESELNFYVEAEAEDQKRMYHGVPAPLLELVSGLPDESVFLSLGDGTASVPVASAVAYLPAEAEAGSQTWRLAPGFEELCAARGLDPDSDGGLRFCLSQYLLESEFTADTLCARDPETRWGVGEAEVRAIVARVDAEPWPGATATGEG